MSQLAPGDATLDDLEVLFADCHLTERVVEPSQFVETLQACCDSATIAHLVLTQGERVIHGQFARVTRDTVSFFGVVSERDVDLLSSSLCCVQFGHGRQSCCFLSLVRDVRPLRQRPFGEFVLDLPTQMLATDARHALRLSLPGRELLQVNLTTADGAVHTPIPLDISEVGLLVAFPPQNDLKLRIGDRVQVALTFDGSPLDAIGVVRRFDGWRLAIMFRSPDGAADGELIASLSRLMESLMTLGLTDQVEH